MSNDDRSASTYFQNVLWILLNGVAIFLPVIHFRQELLQSFSTAVECMSTVMTDFVEEFQKNSHLVEVIQAKSSFENSGAESEGEIPPPSELLETVHEIIRALENSSVLTVIHGRFENLLDA